MICIDKTPISSIKWRQSTLVLALFGILLPAAHAQTTIALDEYCDCEITKSTQEVTAGSSTPPGVNQRDLLIDPTGDLFYWDGSKWITVKTTANVGSGNGTLPIGSVISYVSAAVPDGWLACDGSAVSRATYSELFAIIGTTYGDGDGGSTFNLPDTRGVFLRGAGSSGFGAYSAALGDFQNDSFKSHSHSIDAPSTVTTTTGNHVHSVDPPNTATTTNGNHTHQATGRAVQNFQYPNGPFVAYDGNSSTTTSAAGNHNHTVNIAAFNSAAAGNHNHAFKIPVFSSAATGDSETRPANIGIHYIIKY